MQCFTFWIAMQFVHACYLSLYLQFQCTGQRSHRGGSASRTKGSATMSPGWRNSKWLNSTWLGEFAHGVRTRRAAASKRVDVSAVGEHSSPSPRTLVRRDQFKLHELTRDICWDGTLPIPVRDCPWPMMIAMPKRSPLSYLAQWETAHGQMIIVMPKRSPLSYLALWETTHGQMMIAMPRRSPLSKLPSPPSHRTMKVA